MQGSSSVLQTRFKRVVLPALARPMTRMWKWRYFSRISLLSLMLMVGVSEWAVIDYQLSSSWIRRLSLKSTSPPSKLCDFSRSIHPSQCLLPGGKHNFWNWVVLAALVLTCPQQAHRAINEMISYFVCFSVAWWTHFDHLFTGEAPISEKAYSHVSGMTTCKLWQWLNKSIFQTFYQPRQQQIPISLVVSLSEVRPPIIHIQS